MHSKLQLDFFFKVFNPSNNGYKDHTFSFFHLNPEGKIKVQRGTFPFLLPLCSQRPHTGTTQLWEERIPEVAGFVTAEGEEKKAKRTWVIGQN